MDRRIVSTLGALAALGTVGGGFALAQDGGTKAKAKTAPAASFQRHLAQDLGVSPDRLRSAARSASTETVDELVKAGKLDATKAAKLEQRIAKRGAAGFARFGGTRHAGTPRAAGVKALAGALKLDRKALVAELRSGKAPATVIAEHGGDRDAIRASVRSAVRTALDKRVTAGGKLTAEKADKRAGKLADRLTGTEPLKAGKGKRAQRKSG